MKLLAVLLAGSGVAWIVAGALVLPSLVAPTLSPMLVVAACVVAIAAGVVLTVRRTVELPSRLAGLWALVVVALVVVMAPIGLSWGLVGFALLYGTIGFVLWVSPPLLVFTWVRAFVLRTGPPPR